MYFFIYYNVTIGNLKCIFSDIFSQLSDGNGHLLMKRLSDYLREVLALPAAVYESPSFSYNDNLAMSIFNQVSHVSTTDF